MSDRLYWRRRAENICGLNHRDTEEVTTEYTEYTEIEIHGTASVCSVYSVVKTAWVESMSSVKSVVKTQR